MSREPARATLSRAGPSGASAFAFRFGALAVLFGLEQLLFPEGNLPVARLLSRAVAGSLFAMGWHGAAHPGLVVTFDGGTFVVGPECTGIALIGLFGAFCLAYPASGFARAWGFGLAAAAISMVNFARLLASAVVDRYAPGWSEFSHDYVWQVGMVGLTVALAWFWTVRLGRAARAG